MSANQTNSINVSHSQPSNPQLSLTESLIEQPVPVPNPDRNLRIFISGANSLLGHSLFEEFRNDHIAIHTGETPHKFFGTVNPLEAETVPIPSSTIKVLNYRTKPRTFKKQLLSCDVFVLDLMNTGNIDEIEYVIKTLKQNAEESATSTSAKEQTLLIVSPVMTWINTPKKLKKHFPSKKADDSDIDENEKHKLRDDESETEDDPTNPGNKVLFFTDSDFQQRVPSPRFQQMKTLEMMALAAQKFSKSLKVHIVCAGLPYGNGESNNVFYEFFRKAWLSLHPELASLPIIGSGKNRIPTIHIVDLARCLKSIVVHKYKQQYFIAVDQAKRQTQERIMKTISEGMGSGLIKNVELSDVIDEDWCEFMTIDLKMQPSLVFKEAKFWHCKQGILKQTMPMLNQEFNHYRGLFPLKVFVTGPPASGKTTFAQKLSEAYGVPHIKILDLVQMGYKLQDSLGDEIRKKAEEIKDQIVADYDKTKKKKDPELDRNTIKVRLPDEFLYRLLKMQMNTAACKNKGFILDSYPRTQNDAKHIFLQAIKDYQPPVEGEEPDESPFPGFTVNEDIIPQYAIVLQGDDAPLKLRVKEHIPADKIAETHYTDPHMDRRLKAYREQNVADSGNSVQCFFNKIIGRQNVMTVHALEDKEKNFSRIQEFIEQNGKPCCLNLITDRDLKFLKQLEKKKHPPPVHHEEAKHGDEHHAEHSQQPLDQEEEEEEEDEVAKIIKREEEEQARREEEARERKRVEAMEAEQRRVKEEQEKAKLEQIRQQERDLLDTRSQPIRQYLMDNVVPHLTQGLIDLCKKVPNDPVDYLADFLLKKADEIDQQRIQEREAAIKAKLEAKAAKANK